MSYATPQDFIDYFGESETIELTHLDDPLAASVDRALLQRHLNHATSEINGYLTGRYSLPLAPVPQILQYHTCDIARYRLDKYKSREDVKDRYEQAIQYLRDVAKGIVSLGLDSNNQKVEESSTPDYVSAVPVFTFDNLRDY